MAEGAALAKVLRRDVSEEMVIELCPKWVEEGSHAAQMERMDKDRWEEGQYGWVWYEEEGGSRHLGSRNSVFLN
jgi:hypothetical protein